MATPGPNSRMDVRVVAAERTDKKALENLDDEDPVKALRARVMEYAASPAGHKEQRFIPYPATWFNDKCYTEDPKEWEQ